MFSRFLQVLLLFFFVAHAVFARADLLVALGGGDERKVKAIQLFHEKKAKLLLFTGEPDPQQIYAHWKVHGIIPDQVSTNTPEDFQVIRHEMDKRHLKSVIIVDSDYHLPQSKVLASETLPRPYVVNFVSVKTNASLSKRIDIILGTIRRAIIK